ncbi:glycosyltransferase family 1 protein [Sphingobium lactosutens]|nr:glycosyltransferase family 1 protein [Sphingobium lactosutens]
MNITTSADWCRRPVGIVRVEREIIKAMLRHFPDRIIPAYLDRIHDRWTTVGDGCFSDIMSDDWVLSTDPDRKAATVHRYLSSFTPKRDDLFISMGSDWSFNIPDRVERLYGADRVLIPACYDLIPLLFPEFTPGPEFFSQFDHHYRAVARLAKSVFAISETSAQSLRDFWDDAGLEQDVPPVKVVPLAAPLAETPPPLECEYERAEFENIAEDGPFVIYVSTIEPRKNHQLLLDLWRELYEERGERCPRLLIVGMRGWGSDELIHMARQMNVTAAGKILIKEGLSDRLLMQLYANAAFAVFPSYFEGWGLAATEACALGKVCVISNAGALVEATHGLMPSYHPLDFPGWKKEITRLLDDEAYRKGLERSLDAEKFKRTWQQFGDDFCATMLDNV